MPLFKKPGRGFLPGSANEIYKRLKKEITAFLGGLRGIGCLCYKGLLMIDYVANGLRNIKLAGHHIFHICEERSTYALIIHQIFHGRRNTGHLFIHFIYFFNEGGSIA